MKKGDYIIIIKYKKRENQRQKQQKIAFFFRYLKSYRICSEFFLLDPILLNYLLQINSESLLIARFL